MTPVAAAADKPVKIETDIVGALPWLASINESSAAEMLCVGSLELRRAGDVPGPTATKTADGEWTAISTE